MWYDDILHRLRKYMKYAITALGLVRTELRVCEGISCLRNSIKAFLAACNPVKGAADAAVVEGVVAVRLSSALRLDPTVDSLSALLYTFVHINIKVRMR